MRITFVLPGYARLPSGGYKVAYAYMNGLAARGHAVTVVYPMLVHTPARFPSRAKELLYHVVARLDRRPPWFTLDRSVRVRWVLTPRARAIPDADVIIATAWQTAEWVRAYGAAKGRKYHLIYDYEHYMRGDATTKERIGRTFGGEMRGIATSPAVEAMLAAHGAHAYAYIPNGIDFDQFARSIACDDAARTMIGFPSRPEPFKGTEDAVRALAIVRAQTPAMPRVWSYGARRPGFLPAWVEYHGRPSNDGLRALYNRTAIFVVPSHYEGWGLPGAEAMACGAALVSTDNGGVRVYATDGQTALLSPPQDPAALAGNILKLLRERASRIALAERGYERIHTFTWERAISAMERAIQHDDPRAVAPVPDHVTVAGGHAYRDPE